MPPDDIFGYIADCLTAAEKDELYSCPLTAMAVFRALEPLPQQAVLRMLLPDCDLPAAVGPAAAATLTGSALDGLRVCLRAGDAWKLNPPFRTSLLLGFAGEGAVAPTKKPKVQDPKQMSEFAWLVWEGLLRFMVGKGAKANKDDGPPVQPGMVDLLESAELIRRGESRIPQITPDGFQFLLKDVYAQLWVVLSQYLKANDRTPGFDKLKVLQFLCRLSYCKAGQGYPLRDLDPNLQQVVRQHLPNFGLLFVPTSKETQQPSLKTYYVTPLGIHLTSRSSARPLFRNPDRQPEASSGYIIVETNYRVYAYIDTARNPLQVALLNLFVDVQYCLPNLAVGTITRDSVLNALRAGISANQLLGYLYQRAHPEMRKNHPVLPETVVDQVRLWERERNRIRPQPGTLYRNFTGEAEYGAYKDRAAQEGGLLHHNDAKQLLVVTRDCEEVLNRLRDRR